MKVTNRDNHAEVELETPEGQACFRAALKGDGDRRYWNRSNETCELASYMQDTSRNNQVVVKCGIDYIKI